jgi:acyl dehydratase
MRLAEVQGRSFEPVGFVLGDRLSVANYAKALSIDEDLYRSAERARSAGWAGRPVPPAMYAFFLAFPDGVWDEIGVTWGRTLAGSIEVEAARLAGEEEWVQGQAHVEAVWERPGRDGDRRQLLRLRSDFTDEKGDVVGRWRVTFVERAAGAPSGAVPDQDPGGGGEPLAWERLAPTSPAPAGVGAGRELPTHVAGPLDRLAFARMSVALDDPNLVHLDEAVAAAAGFPTVIGSGGFVVGALWEVVGRWAGIDRVVRGSTKQLLPLRPGTTLTARGSVVSVEDRHDRTVAVCATELVDQDGQRIGEGTFDALVGG